MTNLNKKLEPAKDLGKNRLKFGNDFIWRRYRKLTDANKSLENQLDNLEHRISVMEKDHRDLIKSSLLKAEENYNITLKLDREIYEI